MYTRAISLGRPQKYLCYTMHWRTFTNFHQSAEPFVLKLDTPRTATVVALSTRAELLAVSRGDFQQLLHDLYGISLQERLLFLRSLAMFQSVQTFKLEALAHMMQAVLHEAGTSFDITREGILYFVVEGECRLRRAYSRKDGGKDEKDPIADEEAFYDSNTITRLGPGDFFGEASVFSEARHDGWYVESHTDCKLYCIAGAQLISKCTPDIVDIMRKASQFKLDFYKDRVARMEEQRKSLVFKALPRAIAKKPPPARVAGAEGNRSIIKPAVASPPNLSRPGRRAKEEIDEDEQEVSVLDELKQHILESALELEKQRLTIYNRRLPKDAVFGTSNSSLISADSPSRIGPNGTSTTSKGQSSSRVVPEMPKQQPASLSKVNGKHVQDGEATVPQNHAYPRDAVSRNGLSAKDALDSAGGLRYLSATSSSNGGAREQGQQMGAECSGYMTTGERGYIGYDTKHMRAHVASRDQVVQRCASPH